MNVDELIVELQKLSAEGKGLFPINVYVDAIGYCDIQEPSVDKNEDGNLVFCFWSK